MKSFVLLLFLVTLVPVVSYFIFAPLLKSFHIFWLTLNTKPKNKGSKFLKQDEPVKIKPLPASPLCMLLTRFNIITSMSITGCISIIKVSGALAPSNSGQCVINQALHCNWWNRPQRDSLPAFTTYRTLSWNQIMSKLPAVAKSLDKCFGFQFSPERESERWNLSIYKQTMKTILDDSTDDLT